MPLQSSGAISISQIRTELASGSYSLRTLSAAAGKSVPDSMSEFYGYSSSSRVYLFTASIGSYPCGSNLGSIAVYGNTGTPAYFTTGYTYYQSDGNYLNWAGNTSYPYYVDNQPASFTLTNTGTVWNGQGYCIFD
jgi:hypothetical protein